MSAQPLSELRRLVGDSGVVEHDLIENAGIAADVTVSPADGEALSELLVGLAKLNGAVWVRGGGERMGVGNASGRDAAWLSTARFDGIQELDASDGVCRARAGTRLDVVRDAAREAGWELPLEPPGERSTLGGCISAAAMGPRSHGFGIPRDVLLGLDVCLGSGERTSCGGRVVKNVTGYDLNKLYTGSFGTLGVVESAWLRLAPRSEESTCSSWHSDDLGVAVRVAIDAGRRSSARVAALSCDASGANVVTEFAGDANSVRHDASWLAGRCDAASTDATAVTRVSDRQATLGVDGLRFRVGVLPSNLERVLRALLDSGAVTLAYPGLRTVYAGFDLTQADAGAVADRFSEIARVAAVAGGEWVCEAAPGWAKRDRDVFGAPADLVPLYRELKHRFDPHGVLNPGRFAGGV
jgi:glycolate oxidase FAD binding subunit